MKSRAILLLIASLGLAAAQITTPELDSPINGKKVTVLSLNEPVVGDGSTPDGANVDQVLTTHPVGQAIQAGVDDNEPVVSYKGNTGRKMLAADTIPGTDLPLSDNIKLDGTGTQVGVDGVGVTSTASGKAEGYISNGGITDAHIEPHSDETTVTAAGKSVSTGVGVNPDQLGGEGPPVVYTSPGRK